MPAVYVEREPPTTLELTERLEEQIGRALPESYRDYLLSQDGGWLDGNSEAVKNVFGLGEVPKSASMWRMLRTYAGRVPTWLLPVADDEYGNLFAVSLRPEDKGSVWFWDHEGEADEGEPPREDNLTYKAEDWPSFLNGLQPVR